MREHSLAAKNHRGSLRIRNVPAQIFRPLSVRVSTFTDQPHGESRHVFVYDGDPERGGEMIAAKHFHGGDSEEGNHAWFQWIPRALGRHTLYVKTLEHSDDPSPGNNTDTMTVDVMPADTKPPRVRLKLTPGRLVPPDGRMVPVTATLVVRDEHDPLPDVRLVSITHNEANDAAREVAGADFGTDDRRFRLRAESSGGGDGNGRIYTVVYSVTDWQGNRTFVNATVTAPHRRGGQR